MDTILVTGSAGHLGRHVCTALARHGLSVRGLDLRAHGHDRGDIRDEARVTDAVSGVVGIIHLAAISRVADAEADPATCGETNIAGTCTVLQAAARSPWSPWVLFASSREVLGSIPCDVVADETTPPEPGNLYARSKLHAEHLVCRADRRQVHTCCVRLTNLFGSPWDRQERAIPTFLRRAQAGVALHIRGPERTFDFLHVDDAVRAVLAIVDRLQSGLSLPPVLQLCSARSVPLVEVARLVLAATDSPSPLVLEPAAAHEVDAFRGSHALATQFLGWTPTVSLETGLARLVAPAGHTAHQMVLP